MAIVAVALESAVAIPPTEVISLSLAVKSQLLAALDHLEALASLESVALVALAVP
jgi:hypothetical protein